MVDELRVYVCRDPRHEELVKALEDLLERVRGEKPKLRVIQLKIKDAKDFPWYLEYLEELFGGIATAEYRRYGIRSLPAVVYKGKTVIQGRVPSQEELEEALAYEGLRIMRREAEERAPPKPAQPPQEAEKPARQPAEAIPEVHAPPQLEKPAAARQPPAIDSLIEVEEVSVEAPREERPSPAKRTCLNCIFYERSAGRCLLLRLEIRDPLNPPCRR
ncbi:MAG: thioredoxin family protein [Thermoproteales archaeon]|nr:thioredoxin family protein [Thermoproteales archaeon]